MNYSRACLIAGVALAACILGCAIDDWPWTTTDRRTAGEFYGFKFPSVRADALRNVEMLRREGVASAVLANDPDTRSAGEKGKDAPRDSQSALSAAANWKVNLAGCNCWLVVAFDGDMLSSVTRFVYRGPVE